MSEQSNERGMLIFEKEWADVRIEPRVMDPAASLIRDTVIVDYNRPVYSVGIKFIILMMSDFPRNLYYGHSNRALTIYRCIFLRPGFSVV